MVALLRLLIIPQYKMQLEMYGSMVLDSLHCPSDCVFIARSKFIHLCRVKINCNHDYVVNLSDL